MYLMLTKITKVCWCKYVSNAFKTKKNNDGKENIIQFSYIKRVITAYLNCLGTAKVFKNTQRYMKMSSVLQYVQFCVSAVCVSRFNYIVFTVS